jgi:hypothetical protein
MANSPGGTEPGLAPFLKEQYLEMQDVFETRSVHAPEGYEPGFSQEQAASSLV